MASDQWTPAHRREDHTGEGRGPHHSYLHRTMTAEVLRTYRYRCDAAQCTEVSPASETAEPPGTWSTVRSTAHHTPSVLPPGATRARLRAMDLESLKSVGQFWLHLCPSHLGAFDQHAPRTDNRGGRGGVAVSCSCGARLAFETRETKDAWLRHYAETSYAEPAQGPTPEGKDDQMT